MNTKLCCSLFILFSLSLGFSDDSFSSQNTKSSPGAVDWRTRNPSLRDSYGDSREYRGKSTAFRDNANIYTRDDLSDRRTATTHTTTTTTTTTGLQPTGISTDSSTLIDHDAAGNRLSGTPGLTTTPGYSGGVIRQRTGETLRSRTIIISPSPATTTSTVVTNFSSSTTSGTEGSTLER